MAGVRDPWEQDGQDRSSLRAGRDGKRWGRALQAKSHVRALWGRRFWEALSTEMPPGEEDMGGRGAGRAP